MLWSAGAFHVNGQGTLAPVDPPRTLVANGLYRHTRNPMYIGVVAVVIGEALVIEAPVLFGWAVLLATAFHLRVVLHEERTLERRFPEPYRRYRQAVPRWVPRRRR
ncbi:MAG: methyltransferase family protein [Acidimicrobiales bacterium]